MNKYVVFKREDWDYWASQGYFNDTSIESQELNDAVVIRRQDAFAPPALDAYANNIQMALSLSGPSTEVKQRLREIADYFHQQATISWNTNRKVPD